MAHLRSPIRLVVAIATAALLAPLAPAWFDGAASLDPDVLERSRTHYAAATDELLAGDAGIVDPELLARRAAVRAALVGYRERALFGADDVADGRRRFGFVDATGRRCAVAYLFDRFGMGELTERIARERNGAMVIDLGSDPEVATALERLGITVAEAARIQGPMNQTIPQAQPGGPAREYGGPADGPGGARPTTGGPVTGGPTAGGPTTGGPSGEVARGGPTTGGNVVEPAAPDWWRWWEYNKLDFLVKPRAIATDGGSRVHAPLVLGEDERLELVRLFERQTQAPDPAIRAAAAIAYGRIGGALAFERLSELLGDAQLDVRHAALLGFGLAGDSRSVSLLLGVARDGRHGERHLTADGRDVARVALGLARRRGHLPELDHAVAGTAALDGDYASMLYPALAATAQDGRVRGFAERVSATLTDVRVPVDVRSRAAESLVHAGGADAANVLSHALGEARPELRRSAAMALADSGHALAYAALATASEVESNVTTRGLLFVNLGRTGEAAHAFLAKELASGKRSTAPLAALGLGVALRRSDAPVFRAALREAARSVKSEESRGAYVLALGIARDAQAVGWLADVLATSGNALTRSFAAQALGMVGTEEARRVLLGAVAGERQDVALVGLAHGIAQFQRDEDVPVLADLVRRVNDPALGNQLAPALVFHDTRGAFELSCRWAADERASRLVRAAALEAAGLIADTRPRLAVAALARQANFELFPPWLEQLWAWGL